jgi:hypothetical protein
VPSHVAEPPVGTGHALQDEPQVLVDELLEHALPQRCVPEGQAHAPLWQT